MARRKCADSTGIVTRMHLVARTAATFRFRRYLQAHAPTVSGPIGGRFCSSGTEIGPEDGKKKFPDRREIYKGLKNGSKVTNHRVNSPRARRVGCGADPR